MPCIDSHPAEFGVASGARVTGKPALRRPEITYAITAALH
jgi:hypothetical protein